MVMIKRSFIGKLRGGIVEDPYPLEWLPLEDQVRTGFEKGTLIKATFEFSSGNTLTYELSDKDE